MTPPSILILSDLHLGDRKSRTPTAATVRPVWQGVDRLVLNGDTAELHDPACIDTAEAQATELVEACAADGVEVCAIAGNHDPFISRLARLSLRDDRILVTHGHTIHRMEPRPLVEGQVLEPGDETSMADEHRLDPADIDRVLSRSRRLRPPPEELETPRNFIGSIGYAVSRPMVLWKILRYWRNFPQWSCRFAEHVQPAAKIVIVGHSHRPGIWRVGTRIVINTGSPTWPGRPWAVRIDGTTVTVHRIDRTGGVWSLHTNPIDTFDVYGG